MGFSWGLIVTYGPISQRLPRLEIYTQKRGACMLFLRKGFLVPCSCCVDLSRLPVGKQNRECPGREGVSGSSFGHYLLISNSFHDINMSNRNLQIPGVPHAWIESQCRYTSKW